MKTKLNCWKINLQLFNENPNPLTQPFRTFASQADFDAHMQQATADAAKTATAQFLKDLGVENTDSLKAILKAHADNENKGKTDLEKAQKVLQTLTGERDTALSEAHKALRYAEGVKQAIALNVNPTVIDDVLTLANIGATEIKDGKADGEAIKTAIDAVLKRVPAFAGSASAGGGEFNGGNNGNHQGDNPWKRETFNLTKQAEIKRTNPALAEQLMKAAAAK